tara:strand:- start:241 stop:372 length:132 start_codon:yes stop_codon:yes gene_type:complete
MEIVSINVARGFKEVLHVNPIVAVPRMITVDFGMEKWRDISIV